MRLLRLFVLRGRALNVVAILDEHAQILKYNSVSPSKIRWADSSQN